MVLKKIYLGYSVLLLAALISSQAIAQNVFRTTSASTIGYLEYLPQGYESNSNKYPVVFFLHGLGERGPASTNVTTLKAGISTVERNGPPLHTKNGVDFPFILISPQLKNNYGDWPYAYIMEVINYCKTYLRIDERRIYITGLSLGGGGTWTAAQENPKLFAAVAPICGSRNSTSKASLLTLENLPVWAFHGDKDSTIPLSRTVNMINALNACKPASKPLAKITVYPGINHNSWTNAYKTDHSIHSPNIYEWMLSFTNTTNGLNKIPIANAGADKVIQVNNVVLTGSGADSDGSISSYAWQKISGPSATLNVSSAKLTAAGLTAGVYTFKLIVKDNGGDTDSDYVRVTVSTGGNSAPIANAGADKTVILPTTATTIVGKASDPDGTIAAYQWAKVSGGTASLTGAATPTLKVAALTSGAYKFRLTVKDNKGLTKSDDVVINVSAGSTNKAPVVSAGPDRVIALPAPSATLFGLASDSDGTIVSYQWVKVSGGACTFTSTSVLRPKISRFTSGSYVFRLTVKDNKGAVRSDEVRMIFNSPPVANADTNKKILLPTDLVWFTGADKDGKVLKYVSSKHFVPVVSLINKQSHLVTLNKLSKDLSI